MKLNLRKRVHHGGSLYYGIVLSVLLLLFLPYTVRSIISPYTKRNDLQEITSGIILLALIPASIILYVAYSLVLNHRLKKRDKKFAISAFAKSMVPSQFPLSPSMYSIAKGKRDLGSKNSFVGDGWGFCDFQFTLYRKTKYGEYRAETNYYAVAAFSLPRKLPNVFFDSKATGGREFKKLFRQSQKHSLEGDFDTHHTTYFHEDYTIDNLSFITPEVMLAIRDAKEYDVELYSNMLYLYNELEDMPQQLEDMEEKGKKIRLKLLNNITTYKDDRIDYGDGRKTVSLLGARLRVSLRLQYFKTVVAIIGIVSGFIYFLWESSEYGSVTVLGLYVILISAGVLLNSLKIIRDVKSDDEYFKKMSNVGI